MRLRKYMYSGLIAATLTPSLAVPSALAQSLPVPELVRSAGTGEDGAAGESETRLRPDLFAIAPVLETDLTTEAAVPLEFRFARPPAVGGDVQGVNAEGFVRRVRVGGNSIAQVVVSRLTRGADYVDLEPQDFTSQFKLVGDRLLPTTEISINGDEAEFVAALAQLSTQAVAEEDEPEEDEREEENSGESAGSDGNEDGGSSNPIAGGYQTPERLAADEDEPTVTYDVTTEGCEPVVDLVSGVVRQQSMSQTLEDGVVVENDACSPNGVVWPIEKNYDACEAIVDIDARLAFPQFETFYTDDKGARYDLEGCQPDEANYHVINEDFDVCTPEVDFEGETVALLSSLSYRNRTGEVVSVSECAPSNKTFDLERDYSACDDFVDLEGREASAQYTYFYVDGQASRHTVSECRADAERTWPIEEREECAMTFDLDKGIATVNTILAYNKEGVDVRVRECAPSETIAPIQMTAEADNCSLQHDFGAGVSTQMTMWTYTHNGQYYQASPCMTSEVTYPHQKVFEVDGQDVCTPIVDLEQGRVARQYRTEIEVDGVREVIAGCQPDLTAELPLYATTDGCTDPSQFTHDLEAGQSYGRERFYYESPTQGRMYVTQCQVSTQTYTHSVDLSGWQYDDAELRAYPLVDVSINVSGTPYVIASDYLEPGTTAVDYTFVRNEDTPDLANAYYEGCYQMVPTNRTEVYQRPDGTSLRVPAGSGETANGGDFCERVREARVNPGWGIKAWLERGNLTMNSDTGTASYSRGHHQNPYWQSIRGGNAWISRFTNNDGMICHFYYINREEERLKITEPGTGKVTYTDWTGVQEVQDGTRRNCDVTKPIGVPSN